MPYTTANPPEAVKGLPKHAIEIFVAAFNSALDQYKDEGKAMATAWAAVHTKYKKNEQGDWIAKEAKVKESMSAEDKRQLLQAALEIKFPSQPETIVQNAWVADVFDTELVYRVGGIDYKAPYVIGEDGKVTLGEPVKVTRQTVYTPMESLRKKQSEIIQEAGRRGKIKNPKVEKLVLSTEPTSENLKEADSVLAWLKEQAMVKTEDGIEFPAAAFAYVPDAEQPSAWRLRLWETLNLKETKKQLGSAAAFLSPGGFRGQKVQIPTEDLSAVKRKIRSAYRSLDVPDEEIPRWVTEATSRTLLTGYIPLTEAKLDKGIAKITVIQAGFNTSKDRYYPLDTLCRDYSVFEGLKMYADHPSESDEINRPERSIRDWVATLKNVHMDKDKVVGEAQIVEPWMQEKLATLRDKGLLPEMGVSINAVGAASEATIEGTKTNYIERIARGRSVDFVTEAGAGGLVQMYEAEKDVDIDFVSLITFKERRPDLVKEIETSVRNSLMKEVKKQMETEEEIKELKEANATLTQENTNLKTEKETAEKAKLLAETKATVEAAVAKAVLPEPAKTRILERFKDAVSTDGLEEAIKAEQAYIAAITEAGKVKGLGGGSPDPEAGHKALVESFGKANPKWTPEQCEIAARGR
ncbi:MAG: ChaB family protein [Dehalococcoidia bacterium]|nr:ChaB family protein [Dehalococcoidia bacterium]